MTALNCWFLHRFWCREGTYIVVYMLLWFPRGVYHYTSFPKHGGHKSLVASGQESGTYRGLYQLSHPFQHSFYIVPWWARGNHRHLMKDATISVWRNVKESIQDRSECPNTCESIKEISPIVLIFAQGNFSFGVVKYSNMLMKWYAWWSLTSKSCMFLKGAS